MPPSAPDTPTPETRSGLGVTCLALFLITAAGAILRFRFLARKPFWFDECYSVELARVTWPNFLRLLWWREANMSLYYLLLRGWLAFGHSGFFIRSLSVVLAAAAIPAIYWLGSLLYNRRVGLIAAALLAFHAYHVRYAQEARSYALLVLLAILSSGWLIKLLHRPGRRNRRTYVLISALAVYAHLYALLLIAAQWLAVRLLPHEEHDDSARSANLRSAWIAVGCAVLPLIVFVAKTGAGPIKWIHRPGLADLYEFCKHLAGSDQWPLLAAYAAACAMAIMSPGRKLLGRAATWEIWRVQFLLLWLIFPVALTIAMSLLRPVFLARYLIFCLPALCLLAAAGLDRLRKVWMLAVTLAAVLLLAMQGVQFVYGNDFDRERDASGAASNFILDHAQPGDAVIFHIAATRVAYEYFRSQRAGVNTANSGFTAQIGPESIFPNHGPGLDYRDFTGKPTAETMDAAASHPRVWLMLMNNGAINNGTPANSDAATAMLTQTLAQKFSAPQVWQFPLVEVRLYSAPMNAAAAK